MHLPVALSLFSSSSCSVTAALDLSHSPVAHLFLLISLAFYLLISPFSISIVLLYTTREACSLTPALDN